MMESNAKRNNGTMNETGTTKNSEYMQFTGPNNSSAM